MSQLLVRCLGAATQAENARVRAEQVRWAIQPFFESRLSYAEIAMELTALRIASPSGRLRWNKMAVHRTLKYLALI